MRNNDVHEFHNKKHCNEQCCNIQQFEVVNSTHTNSAHE
jgi:hypothetical protein